MSTGSAFNGTTNELPEKIVDASQRQTMVVYFWTPGCIPCRDLGPALERAVASFNKGAALVKVNTDKDRDTARFWGVRTIPYVKIVKRGKVVKEFTGDLPEFAIKMLLGRVVSARTGGQ